jgi:hypothetical protein
MPKTPRKRSRRRFDGKTVTFSITLPQVDRNWADGLARPRGVGVAEIIRDALDLYKATLRTLAPRRKNVPPVADIITTVRTALEAYLAQQHADQPAASVAAEDAPGGVSAPALRSEEGFA